MQDMSFSFVAETSLGVARHCVLATKDGCTSTLTDEYLASMEAHHSSEWKWKPLLVMYIETAIMVSQFPIRWTRKLHAASKTIFQGRLGNLAPNKCPEQLGLVPNMPRVAPSMVGGAPSMVGPERNMLPCTQSM